jgi:hypothetical protein
VTKPFSPSSKMSILKRMQLMNPEASAACTKVRLSGVACNTRLGSRG